VSSHPPYSPDLFPADIFLFPKLKIAKQWTRFEAVSSIQQTVTIEVKAIREEACGFLQPQFGYLIVTLCRSKTRMESVETSSHYNHTG
jgi:hypothetical protein